MNLGGKITPSSDGLCARFKTVARQHHYEVLPSFPLSTQDPTLLLVNASMAPFKAEMKEGSPIEPPVAIVQRCFRNQGAPQYLYAFDMLGMLANAEELPRVTADIFAFLTREARLDCERLHGVADVDDRDLWQALAVHLPSERLHAQHGNIGAFDTRWQYGADSKISGRGLTIAYDSAWPDQPVGKQGYADLVPLGNIIIIERDDGGRSYVEAGFGAEVLSSAQHHGDMRRIAPHFTMLDTLGALAGPPMSLSSMEVVKSLIGAASLAEHGVRPGPRGASYVMRKLLRGLGATLLEADVAPEDLLPRFDMIYTQLSRVWPAKVVSEAGWRLLSDLAPVELAAVAKHVAQLETDPVRKKIARYFENNDADKTVKLIQDSYGVPSQMARQFVDSNFASEY